MTAFEVNFDGLVGPTHNYGGLSYGNVASFKHTQNVSRPREAVKQGLVKMKALNEMGLKQGVLPPQERPDLQTLRRLGFSGSDQEVIYQANRQAPHILRACCSGAAMWTANAATVSPSADTKDGRVHFTPANLVNKFHRSTEHPTTRRALQAIFRDPKHFQVHEALPSVDHFGDEGAANHTRFCHEYGKEGVEFFVFGKYAFDAEQVAPKKYPARHTYEASAAVARLHGLSSDKVVFAQQNPAVIDAGVFHNDVIAVGNGNVLFYHEKAFLDQQRVFAELQEKLGGEFHFVEAPDSAVSVKDAVGSYLFNSQLVSIPNQGMKLIAPEECNRNPAVKQYLEELVTQDHPIKEVAFFDLRQSMKNGGGPACLRLRVVLNEQELQRVNPAVLYTPQLFESLNLWADKRYREELSEADLADPQLVVESRTALDELTQILELGSIYPFQL